MVSFTFTTNSNLASWQKPNCQTLQNYLPFSQMRYILEAISISGCHFELSWKIGENVVLKRVIIIQQMHKTLFTVDMITYIESFRRYPNLEYKRIFQRYIKEGNLPFCWNIWTLKYITLISSIVLPQALGSHKLSELHEKHRAHQTHLIRAQTAFEQSDTGWLF